MRVRYNTISGILSSILNSSGNTMSSDDLVFLPAVTAPDYLPLTINPTGSLDPADSPQPPEVVYVTSHSSGSSSATIIRGCEGYTPQTFPATTEWILGATREDYVNENLAINGDFGATSLSSPNQAWNWNYAYQTVSGGATFSLATTPTLGSFQSVAVTVINSSNGAVVASAPFNVYLGETITVEGYVANDGSAVGGTVLGVALFNSSSGIVSSSALATTLVPLSAFQLSTAWSRYSVQMTIPSLIGSQTPTRAVALIGQITPSVTGTNFFAKIQATRRTTGGSDSGFPPGFLGATYGSTAPTGWLARDGTTYLIAQYPNLFKAIGNQFGGDGSTTFAVPNDAGVVIMGSGTSTFPPNTTYLIGSSGGVESVTLSQAQTPVHNHGYSGSSNTGGESNQHDHQQALVTARQYPTSTLGLVSSGPSFTGVTFSGDITGPDNTGHGHGYSWSGTTTPVGSGNSHENRQPYRVALPIIKY